MRRHPLQWREPRHHYDLQISNVRLTRNSIERDQNQVKDHQNHEQQPRVLFGSVFGPVSQRHESESGAWWSARGGWWLAAGYDLTRLLPTTCRRAPVLR